LEDHDDKMLDDGSMTNGNGQIILPKIRLLWHELNQNDAWERGVWIVAKSSNPKRR
jgi:hypothetical protein